jgi:hypothetical protein
MTNTKQHLIKAVIDYRCHTAAQVVTDATNIGTALFANLDKFKDAPTPPPVDQATLKKETDILVSVNAAAENGGKKELAQQKHQKEVVVKLIILLGHWVEANCKDDMTTFLSTGFQATASTKSKTPPESGRYARLYQVGSGQMFVWLVVRDAAGYSSGWAPVPAEAVLTVHAAAVGVKARLGYYGCGPAYVFQARAGQSSYSDYSQPITRVAVWSMPGAFGPFPVPLLHHG